MPFKFYETPDNLRPRGERSEPLKWYKWYRKYSLRFGHT